MKTEKYLFDLVYVALLKITLTTNVPNNCLSLYPTSYCACWHDYSACLHNRKNPSIIMWDHIRVQAVPSKSRKQTPCGHQRADREIVKKILSWLSKRISRSALDGSDVSSTFFCSSRNSQSSHSERVQGTGLGESPCHQDARPEASEKQRMPSAVS